MALIGFWESKIDKGLPTVIPRPITNTFTPDKLILYSANKATIAFGVQATTELKPKTRLPKLFGVRPSASFAGLIADITFCVSTPTGSGS